MSPVRMPFFSCGSFQLTLRDVSRISVKLRWPTGPGAVNILRTFSTTAQKKPQLCIQSKTDTHCLRGYGYGAEDSVGRLRVLWNTAPKWSTQWTSSTQRCNRRERCPESSVSLSPWPHPPHGLVPRLAARGRLQWVWKKKVRKKRSEGTASISIPWEKMPICAVQLSLRRYWDELYHRNSDFVCSEH